MLESWRFRDISKLFIQLRNVLSILIHCAVEIARLPRCNRTEDKTKRYLSKLSIPLTMDKLDFWSRRHPKKVHFERTLIADKEANRSNIQAQNLIYRLGSWNTVRWSMILRNGNPYTLINLCSSALNIIGGFSQIHSHTYFYLKLKRNRKSNFKWFFFTQS